MKEVFFYYFFFDRTSSSSGWPQAPEYPEDVLEPPNLLPLLPQSPKCWDYRQVQPCLVYIVLGVGLPDALCVLGKHSSTQELCRHPKKFLDLQAAARAIPITSSCAKEISWLVRTQ